MAVVHQASVGHTFLQNQRELLERISWNGAVLCDRGKIANSASRNWTAFSNAFFAIPGNRPARM